MQVEPGHDSDFAIQCALLHDVLEDTNVTLDEIKSRFGEKIASGVFALSKNPDLSNSLQMADCLKKIQQQPHEVWMVKLADRITNLQPPPRDWSNVKRIHYQREAMEIYKTLGSASKFLASRLSEKIKTYEQYFISPEGIQHNSII